jgi:cell division protein FtsL
MLLVSTFMVMFLVMSISDIYETTNEIADLEREIATLRSDAEDLSLQLEEKNDIRLIEEIATKQLGMTKEDSLQRRYVSLSDGEHIDILEVEEEEEKGVLLSSLFSSIGDLLK